jgi:small subunit ribosomal protein S7
VLQKLVNVIMLGGKKNAARKIVYDAMDILTKKFSGDKGKAVELFNRSFQQIVPIVEVRSRRVGGSVYQIPREVSFERGRALALRWIIGAAKARSNKTMGERLAYELIDASEGRGVAVKKKADVHRMAEANRAFSHYSW